MAAALFPCPQKSECADNAVSDQVARNFTSELADQRRFFSIWYPPQGFPGFPPGGGGGSGPPSFCESGTQEAADLCATRPEPQPFGDGYPPPIGNRAQSCDGNTVDADTFFAMTQELADALALAVACNPDTILFDNTTQTCSQDCAGQTMSYTVPSGVFVGLDQVSADLTAFLFACAVLQQSCMEGEELPPPPTAPNTRQSCSMPCTGGEFSYIVPYNTYRSFNQSAANSVAQTAACNLASSNRTCITPINDSSCVGDFYGEPIGISGPLAGQVNSIKLASGTLPPGVNISGVSLFGIPSTAGIYNFVLRAVFSGGHSTTANGTIRIGEVTGTLANGTQNAPYAGVVSAPGFTNPIFSIAGGALPTGMFLNPDGTIAGTPTVAGVFDFIVEATE